jgi:hypothetical protein
MTRWYRGLVSFGVSADNDEEARANASELANSLVWDGQLVGHIEAFTQDDEAGVRVLDVDPSFPEQARVGVLLAWNERKRRELFEP